MHQLGGLEALEKIPGFFLFFTLQQGETFRIHESVLVFNGSLEEQEFRTLPSPSFRAMLTPPQASRPRSSFGEKEKGWEEREEGRDRDRGTLHW